jgi:hypothetical protein
MEEVMPMRYVLNRNAGVDTLHREHPWEQCNVDDAEGVRTIEEDEALRLRASGDAVPCQHCKPEGLDL